MEVKAVRVSFNLILDTMSLETTNWRNCGECDCAIYNKL
jgi:hypothetical protein